jgi:uncharacterized protein YijF (DUF1287 family)
MLRKIFFLLIAITLIVLFAYAPFRAILESYYLRYGYEAYIEDEPPATKPLQISYYAKKQLGVTTAYTDSYEKLSYPGGDVNITTGVCTDVVVRALRGIGVDLQKEIHEDMQQNFKSYPQNWGLKKPDPNIDHRRVPNIKRYLKRKHYALPVTDQGSDYQPGDIVTWGGGRWKHIGIVSNIKKTGTDRYYIVHNSYKGVEISDWLFAYTITGHYRIR